MSPDEIKKRIVNEIKARGYDDYYIDKAEEREIIQIAIQLGVTVENALAALNEVCDEYRYVLESRVLQQIDEQLSAAVRNDGLVDQQEFERVFATTKEGMQGKKSDREIKTLIVTVMERTGRNKVKKGWFRNWYASLKQELGLT